MLGARMTTERKAEPTRFYEVDLLRFLAAFAVLLFHYTFRGHAADDLTVHDVDDR